MDRHMDAASVEAGMLSSDTEIDSEQVQHQRFLGGKRAVFALISVAGLALAAVVISSKPWASTSSLGSVVQQDAIPNWVMQGEWASMGAAQMPNAPVEIQNDHNLCGDDEEEFAGLCYKTCEMLTNRVAPIRTSSFSCCKGRPCDLTNQIFNVRPCAGFDVGGSINGENGECPHTEGTCLTTEEMLLGVCYEKCSILTNNQYPLRVAATTCCKATTVFGCLNPMNLKTNIFKFAVGGGKQDGSAATPAGPHGPMKELTELDPDGVTGNR